MTDEQLLREMRKGNQEALQQMIQRYHRYLTTIIGNILGSGGSREDIEELVQDTFYAVWNRAGEIRGPLKPYLCIARRETGQISFTEKSSAVFRRGSGGGARRAEQSGGKRYSGGLGPAGAGGH